MKLRQITLTLAVLGVSALLSACDREVSHQTKVKARDGEVKTQETTVTETPKGSIKVEEKTTAVEDGKTTTETTTKEFEAPKP
jgi:hypothetical protein